MNLNQSLNQNRQEIGEVEQQSIHLETFTEESQQNPIKNQIENNIQDKKNCQQIVTEYDEPHSLKLLLLRRNFQSDIIDQSEKILNFTDYFLMINQPIIIQNQKFLRQIQDEEEDSNNYQSSTESKFQLNNEGQYSNEDGQIIQIADNNVEQQQENDSDNIIGQQLISNFESQEQTPPKENEKQ